jgi:16S rRNA G966 N2-methylase RsmD
MSIDLNSKWQSYYKMVRGVDWPDECNSEDDILNLPKNILKELLFDFLIPANISSDEKEKVQQLSTIEVNYRDNSNYFYKDHSVKLNNELVINDIRVFYSPELDGGGTTFGRRYPNVINSIYKDRIFENCFEWCSGPGFIGFELLSEDICKNLFLADIYKPALAAIDKTIKHLPTKYQNVVHPIQIKGIADLPEDWKFDLIVSNPPHWNPMLDTLITKIKFNDRICLDYGWQLHSEFFANIANHLNDNGVILLQEQSYASGPDMFIPMIDAAGLKLNDCYFEVDNTDFYYLEVLKK